MACPVSSGGKRPQIKRGDIGMLQLRYQDRNREKSIRLRGQIIHLSAQGMGLAIRFADMTRADQRVLHKILETGNSRL